VLFVLKIKGIF